LDDEESPKNPESPRVKATKSCLPWVQAALLLMPMPASTQAAPARLTLEALLVRVYEDSPRLHAMRAGAEAAALRRPEASTLPDPLVQLGIMNVGLPKLNADMPASMAPSVQLMQMIPFPGKLGLRGAIASLDEAMASASLSEMEWEVRAMAASMFFDLYAMDRRTEVMEETLGLLRDFQQVAKAMYVSGMGRQADVLRADVEVARVDGEIRTMRAGRAAMAARLNGLMGRAADAPVASPVLPDMPLHLPPPDTLRAWAEASRPLLAHGRQGVDQARSRVALARKELWPDLTVGLAYGQRGADMGTERMGSAMVGFSLPIFASRRQHAMRDEALAMARMADADLAGRQAEVGARIGEVLAELERARSLTVLYRDEILPEARITVESALSSYRVGNVDFMTLVDAQMTVNEFQGEWFGLLAAYGKGLAALEAAVGRRIPASSLLLAEVS
jgi:outer membrane protein TolC